MIPMAALNVLPSGRIGAAAPVYVVTAALEVVAADDVASDDVDQIYELSAALLGTA